MVTIPQSNDPEAFYGPTSAGLYVLVFNAGAVYYGPENATPVQLEAGVSSAVPFFVPADRYFYHQGSEAQLSGVRLGDEFFPE